MVGGKGSFGELGEGVEETSVVVLRLEEAEVIVRVFSVNLGKHLL